MAKKYEFIRELDKKWQNSPSELQPLADIWQEQLKRLGNSEGLKNFNERFNQKWAIETGIIENLYTLDRGVTELLLEQGINASLIPHSNIQDSQEVSDMINAQSDALNGLFHFVTSKRPFSTSWIKELHQIITKAQHTVTAIDQHGKTGQVPLLKGKWKDQPNNPSTDETSGWFYNQIVQTAREFDYFADTQSFREWARLKIAMESEEDIQSRFEDWLEESINIALRTWQEIL